MTSVAKVLLFSVLAMTSTACSSVKNAAAKDPQQCERDPKCTHKSDKSQDCPTVCADNIDCISRCDQVNEPNR